MKEGVHTDFDHRKIAEPIKLLGTMLPALQSQIDRKGLELVDAAHS